jgi:hypothetical protein
MMIPIIPSPFYDMPFIEPGTGWRKPRPSIPKSDRQQRRKKAKIAKKSKRKNR